MGALIDCSDVAEWSTEKARAQHGINVLQQRITETVAITIRQGDASTPQKAMELMSALIPAITQYITLHEALHEHHF